MKVIFIVISMAFAIASLEGSVVENRAGKIYGVFKKYKFSNNWRTYASVIGLT